MTKQIITLLILSLFLNMSCSIPKAIKPIYEKNKFEILKEIQSFGEFEDVAINGSVISHGNKNTNILVVQLLNNKNGNDDKIAMNEFGKKIMKIVINSIKNENEYDKFQIVFIQKSSKGVLNKEFTISFEYNLEQLRK